MENLPIFEALLAIPDQLETQIELKIKALNVWHGHVTPSENNEHLTSHQALTKRTRISHDL